MMALAGVELETLVSEPDTLTTRPPPDENFVGNHVFQNAGEDDQITSCLPKIYLVAKTCLMLV